MILKQKLKAMNGKKNSMKRPAKVVEQTKVEQPKKKSNVQAKGK